MKSALILTAISLLVVAVRGCDASETTGGYVQNPSGNASFTSYANCGNPACGIPATGYTAAMSQLSFGAPPDIGPGDACGRCFRVTGTGDPYNSAYPGPYKSIVVKITDLCPVAGNPLWCAQTTAKPTNTFNMSVHFDLCRDTGTGAAFFTGGRGAFTGTYQEVSCDEWSGTDGSKEWADACLSGETADNWPAVGCGNLENAP